MDDMRISSAVLTEAYEHGGLAEELLKMRKNLLTEQGFGFAGKTFSLENGVDILWSLRIQAYHGIVVEESSRADFIVGDFAEEAIEINSEDDADEDDIKKESDAKKASNLPKHGTRVSTAWVSRMIGGF